MSSYSISYLWEKSYVFLISGPSAERYLHGRCTQDIKSMKSGELRWSLILNPQGRVEGQFLIGRAADQFYIFSDPLESPEEEENFLKALLRFKVADQFEVINISRTICRLSLFNNPQDVDNVFKFLHENIQDHTKLLKFKLGVPGYSEDLLLFLDFKSSYEDFSQIISQKITLSGSNDYLKFRIEHLIPQMYLDIDNGIIAPDLPLDNYLSPGKGCYAGQEVVEMATARGRPNRKLVKISSLSTISNIKRNSIFAGELEIGFLTSGMNFDNSSGAYFLALGFIKNKPIEGLEILIQDQDQMIPALIANV